MAKKKSPKRGETKWQPQPNDAIQLSALRWFALTIEKGTIELYATNSKAYLPMVKLLRKTLDELSEIRSDLVAADECPEGYILCESGLCQPACRGISGPVNDES